MKKMMAFVKKNAESNDFVMMEVPIPKIDEDEILIQVKAIGVGIQDGYFFPETMQFPYPIGIEGAGIVEKIGKNVTQFEVGDKIAFIAVLETKGGTYAEYIAIGNKSVAVPIPDGMSFVEAAAIPVAGNAMSKVFKALHLDPEDKIFIAGASGANGTFAIQYAKYIGCKIAASASKSNHRYMKSLGAEKTVDYHDSDWVEKVLDWAPGGVDVAIAIQPVTSVQSMKVVKDGGKIISVSGERFGVERNVESVYFPFMMDVREELIQLMDKIAYGDIKLNIENIFSFEDAHEALKKVRTRRAQGKSVITLED